MYIRSESTSESFIANDGCRIVELVHPKHSADIEALEFSLAVAEVAVGEETYRHRLEQTEAYYILAGRGEMHIDDEAAVLTDGDAVVIPAGSVQWIRNVGEVTLKFTAIVSPPWSKEGDHLVR